MVSRARREGRKEGRKKGRPGHAQAQARSIPAKTYLARSLSAALCSSRPTAAHLMLSASCQATTDYGLLPPSTHTYLLTSSLFLSSSLPPEHHRRPHPRFPHCISLSTHTRPRPGSSSSPFSVRGHFFQPVLGCISRTAFLPPSASLPHPPPLPLSQSACRPCAGARSPRTGKRLSLHSRALSRPTRWERRRMTASRVPS